MGKQMKSADTEISGNEGIITLDLKLIMNKNHNQRNVVLQA